MSKAFTSAFKELDPIPQFKATAKLTTDGTEAPLWVEEKKMWLTFQSGSNSFGNGR